MRDLPQDSVLTVVATVVVLVVMAVVLVVMVAVLVRMTSKLHLWKVFECGGLNEFCSHKFLLPPSFLYFF
jgi:hypothetical protein